MTPREKVLRLVADGTVSASEGDLLLQALRPERTRFDTWLIEPFELMSPAAAMGAAVAVSVASIGLSVLQVRFDGALDLHIEGVSWATAAFDQLMAWPAVALVFWAAARLSGRPARLLEMVAFVGAARLPHLLAGLCGGLAVATLPEPALPAAFALTLPLVGWTFLWLLGAYRAASGGTGRRLALGFVAALVGAEMLSSVVLGAST